MKRGLVLAGGGVAGIAWELGVLLGVRDGAPGAQLVDADVVIGTSAGSTVAAQITSGVDLADLYDAQLREESSEIDVDINLEELMARFASAAGGATSVDDARQRVGALAFDTETVTEAARRAAIAGRLPTTTWPDRTLLIPAVDARTGEVEVFTSSSGVDMLDAITASSAVPGVWPPATIDGRRFIDGGVRSMTNADLVAGCERILVITTSRFGDPAPWGDLDAEVASLAPAEVMVVYADDATVAAFGSNPLSPATRRPAAHAGRAIGRAHAAEIARFWA